MSGYIPKLREDCIFERYFDGTFDAIEHGLSILDFSLVKS